ncbi:hypothetical protein H310_04405 [Aphanomyces invadans]|uniref:Uncharacterized protein n=1 Tax=Aphanomyces invadans TaxID=157072 RepID=A0A024UCR9_9STRA|nr:hypothetical protein H310_04405 [Aphanomyces invadans]ETW04000.1 hypothetical protein H310_04405 [Aphanomyces invadans]|eukprot:XP_008866956.1 hypothetical protein H310_04405 [Aphanomyces invadans]
MARAAKTGRELTESERMRLYCSIAIKKDGVAAHCAKMAFRAEYGVTQQAASLIWQHGQSTEATLGYADLSARKRTTTLVDVEAESTGIALTTLWRLVMAKKKTAHKPREGRDVELVWHDMFDRVHIDEKWFFVTQVNRRYCLWHDEELRERKCQSKRHFTKVMRLQGYALAAVTKSVYRQHLIENVIPAIKDNRPGRRADLIWIQQDTHGHTSQ